MKKLIVFISMMFFLMGSAFAQKGIQAFGVHLGYGSEIESASIGVKYQYNITNNIRLEPSANYFFEKKGIDMFDFNANAHYRKQHQTLSACRFDLYQMGFREGNQPTRSQYGCGG